MKNIENNVSGFNKNEFHAKEQRRKGKTNLKVSGLSGFALCHTEAKHLKKDFSFLKITISKKILSGLSGFG